MLAETTITIENDVETAEPAGLTTYIPGALLLLMALDNGWDIVLVKPVAHWEPYGPVYLVTLRCHSDGKAQRLIIPKSALVAKIFEQYVPATARPC